jgi:hypothetical protein
MAPSEPQVTARVVSHQHPFSIVTVHRTCKLPWMPSRTGPQVLEVQGDARAFFRTNSAKALLAHGAVTVRYIDPCNPQVSDPTGLGLTGPLSPYTTEPQDRN